MLKMKQIDGFYKEVLGQNILFEFSAYPAHFHNLSISSPTLADAPPAPSRDEPY